MNPASYGKWVIQYDKKNTHFKCCLEILKMMYESDQYAKVLVFMPLIDLCEECAYFLKRKLGMDKSFDYDLDIRTINSKNSKKDNDYAKRADVIITTIASCGTGTDIPGITGIISCSPFVSKITAEQLFGRIRYCGKVCQYYDIYDTSVQMDVFWWKSRSKKLKQLALNTNMLYWTPDEDEVK
jgi:superfamily II DNA or RNA helicase